MLIDNNDYLWHIKSGNPPDRVELPIGEQLYTIDLNTRIINGPSELSVKDNHEADLVYFIVDRYFETTDLAETFCVVQFETINKNNGETYKGVYFIPLYDITTFAEDEKMILPWQIRNSVTQSATNIKYNFRFYMIDPETNEIIYNLNTMTSVAKILDTLTPKSTEAPSPEDTVEELKKWKYLATEFEELYNTVHQALQWNRTNWEILE